MVRLNRIYTKTGDDGTTGLGTGERVPTQLYNGYQQGQAAVRKLRHLLAYLKEPEPPKGFKDIMGMVPGLGRREDSLALAALGRGGAPSRGSYEKALVADRTARQFAPQFGNIISNI